MRIRVGEEVFPLVTHRGAPNGHMIELQLGVKKLYGVSAGMTFLERIGREQAAYSTEYNRYQAGEISEPPEDPEFAWLAVGTMIFLSIRAVKKISFADAMELIIDDWIQDPEDTETVEGEPEPDPTQPGNDTPVTPGNEENPVTPTE